jgi:alkanesulfonate monooxygenase SsuD/methylene tetrahydromethanopterin reductase-like flavin-dependent oxidoreductase (luciferase family)
VGTQIGLHLTPFFSPTDRPAADILDDAITVVRAASTMGYRWVSAPQHWLSHPTVWPQPFPLLARLAPETGTMRLRTSILLLPILNPVEVAENAATLDHLCHGRLILGVGNGYREAELEAAGLTRQDRVPKVEESIALMKRLWAGEEVTFEGRYCRVRKARMGFTPYQQPHPPLELGAQSEGAARRAALITDGIFLGPQISWASVTRLAGIYRRTREENGQPLGTVGASRSLIVGRDREDAARSARAYLERTFTTYRTWAMQERTMEPLQLGFDIPPEAWMIHGSPRDCVETIQQAAAEAGLTHVAFTIYNLPREAAARIAYLQMIAEEIVGRVA